MLLLPAGYYHYHGNEASKCIEGKTSSKQLKVHVTSSESAFTRVTHTLLSLLPLPVQPETQS